MEKTKQNKVGKQNFQRICGHVDTVKIQKIKLQSHLLGAAKAIFTALSIVRNREY